MARTRIIYSHVTGKKMAEFKDGDLVWSSDEYGAPAPTSHMVAPDLPGYESPVTGKWVEGRAQRREDLKRTGCRPFEDGERQEAARQRAYQEQKFDAGLTETAARAFYQMPEAKRRLLTRG